MVSFKLFDFQPMWAWRIRNRSERSLCRIPRCRSAAGCVKVNTASTQHTIIPPWGSMRHQEFFARMILSPVKLGHLCVMFNRLSRFEGAELYPMSLPCDSKQAHDGRPCLARARLLVTSAWSYSYRRQVADWTPSVRDLAMICFRCFDRRFRPPPRPPPLTEQTPAFSTKETGKTNEERIPA